MPPSSPLRRELLFALAFLFGGALLLSVVGLSTLLPVFADPAEALIYLVVLFAVDLAVVFAFAADFLRRNLVRPIEDLVEDVKRIADGDHGHRVRAMPSAELGSIEENVNAMADHLLRDRQLLATNVRSLERSNQELVEARDQILRSARLASVGALAAGIAHEVGNPLSAILGYVDVARSRAEREGAGTELFGAIRGEAERIDRIVRSLLDYARPGNAGLASVDPASVLGRVRELLEAQGKLDAVTAEWDVEESGLRVDVEAHRLEQVIVNLLLNAADALEHTPHGRIRIRLAFETGGAHGLPARRESDPLDATFAHRRREARNGGGLSGERPERLGWVVITVRDNGPGIPGDDLDAVFDPFFTTKPPGKGTGLGLFVCARLIEGMGGTIAVANGVDGGAVFTVRLPAAGGPSGGDEPR